MVQSTGIRPFVRVASWKGGRETEPIMAVTEIQFGNYCKHTPHSCAVFNILPSAFLRNLFSDEMFLSWWERSLPEWLHPLSPPPTPHPQNKWAHSLVEWGWNDVNHIPPQITRSQPNYTPMGNSGARCSPLELSTTIVTLHPFSTVPETWMPMCTEDVIAAQSGPSPY